MASAAAEGSARTAPAVDVASGSTFRGSPVSGSPTSLTHPHTAAGPGWRVPGSPGAAAHRLGAGAAPPRCGKEFSRSQRWSRRCRGAAGPGRGAGTRSRVTPRPRTPLSSQRSPSFVPLSNRRSWPIAIEPVGPAARRLAEPPAGLCQSRRSLLPQTKAAALATALRSPRPPRVLRGGGPLADGQPADLPPPPRASARGEHCEKASRKVAKASRIKVRKGGKKTLFHTNLSVWVRLASAKRHFSLYVLIF